MKTVVRLLASASLALLMTTAAASAAPEKAIVTTPVNAILEKITFENAGLLDQTLVLGWIDTRPGDFLTPQRLARIEARLKTLGNPRTFSYKSGSKPGQVVLSIGAGC